MAFEALTTAEVDAKSPIDDALMGKVKDNFDDLDSRATAAGATTWTFELHGRLKYLSSHYRSLCFAAISAAFTPSRCRWVLKKSGTGGTLAFDIRKHSTPETPIIEIAHQYSAATSSISQQGSALNTQSIARRVAQISTQSITHAKAAKNIQSIILLGDIDEIGTNLVQYNLDAAIDSDTVIGDSFVAASCSSAANDGTFVIIEKNRGGGSNVVVSNSIGVAQTGVAGTIQEKIMSYNFTNPVSSTGFTAGYAHEFAGHTSGANDGDLTVYAINQAGNNIWVKNPSGVVQGGVAGTADTNFWIFTVNTTASATDYIVGESAKTASHTSGGNDSGALEIIAVNEGGDNLVLHNASGAVQGGVAGTVNTNRWAYNMPSDPTADVSAGQTIYAGGHTNPLNDGTFAVKEVTASKIVIYNVSGVAQGGAAGNVYHTRKLIKFASDQSADYSTDSYIEMKGCVDSTYNLLASRAPYRVLEVNRGGGANYNVVIDAPTGAAQVSPAGRVAIEMRSIFSAAPSQSADVTGLDANHFTVGTSTDLIASAIAAQTPLALYVTSWPSGDPRDLTITIL